MEIEFSSEPEHGSWNVSFYLAQVHQESEQPLPLVLTLTSTHFHPTHGVSPCITAEEGSRDVIFRHQGAELGGLFPFFTYPELQHTCGLPKSGTQFQSLSVLVFEEIHYDRPGSPNLSSSWSLCGKSSLFPINFYFVQVFQIFVCLFLGHTR